MKSPLARVRAAAGRFGLNLVASIPVEDYDRAVAPGLRTGAQSVDFAPRSIVTIGNGGGDFWRAFEAFAAGAPGWRERANPLDDFTRAMVEGEVLPAARAAGMNAAAVFPFFQDGPGLNFMELAKVSGLAGPSLIGVVVHPHYGPWIAFRAALLVDALIDEPGGAAGFDPCPRCTARSCIAACPAGAVRFPEGWNIPGCLKHRVEAEPDCASQCAARVACVLGPEHRYPSEELAYHQRRALAAMRPWYEAHLAPRR